MSLKVKTATLSSGSRRARNSAVAAPTRIIELVIHGLDLAWAIGGADKPPRAPTEVTLHLLADLALELGKAAELASAVTGHPSLPEGFNLVD